MMYCQLTDHARPSIAFFENRIVVISKGIRIGKLNIDINVALFPAFDAIALTIESTDANPELPRITARINMGKSWTGFPMNNE